MPELAEKCIESWKKYCPDYEIICWDKSNYDFHKHPFMRQAYQEKNGHSSQIMQDLDKEYAKPSTFSVLAMQNGHCDYYASNSHNNTPVTKTGSCNTVRHFNTIRIIKL